jgi:hypothetical protein
MPYCSTRSAAAFAHPGDDRRHEHWHVMAIIQKGPQRQVGAPPPPASAVSDDQIFHSVWYVSLLLMVLAAMVPLARSRRHWLRHAAWWVLIAGFLFALYRVFEWAAA